MGNRRLAIACWIGLSASLGGGCGGDSLGRLAISGTVKVDGAPLEKGTISFQPTEGARTSSGAVIAAGNFSVPRDKGLVPGKYRVAINAAAPGTRAAPAPDAAPGDAPPPPKELIPPDWNESSTHTIDVKKEGPFNFPFEIATKGK
jgi:hypothetical protein